MSPRTDLVLELQALVGETLAIEELASGWPSLVTLVEAGETRKLALFVSAVGRSHRNRDNVERRFQNPAGSAPIQDVPGYESVLLALWSSDELVHVRRPIVVVADAERRAGRETRWSVFLSLSALVEAVDAGWSSHTNDTGETIRYMAPELLPVAVEAALAGTRPNDRDIYRAVAELGITPRSYLGGRDDSERIRRSVSQLVRDSRFSGRVLSAYGRTCSMCDLGLGLVQAAHIYPASAPGSSDHPSNGLALCANHHLAFDRYLIAVRPKDLAIFFSPEVLGQMADHEATARFVNSTRQSLRLPTRDSPDPTLFVMRYDYFEAEYHWTVAEFADNN